MEAAHVRRFLPGLRRCPQNRWPMLDVDIRPAGDAAVLAVLGDSIDPVLCDRVWSLARALDGARSPGVLDIVPSYASVLVRFDPLVIDLPRVMAAVRGAAERSGGRSTRPSRRLTVRVCFGGECG